MISLRVIKTTDEGKEWYYNTLTGERLPITEDQDFLRQHLCLEGQDHEAIVQTLMKDRGIFSLTVIPTWECNLRCTHCSVTTMLKTADHGELDTTALLQFIDRYLTKFNPPNMSLHFVGGEPLLRADKCLEITKAVYDRLEGTGITCMMSLTTNATLEFTDTVFELFELLDKVNVSVDGTEIQHNLQRRPLQQLDNPYNKTIENLRKVVERGLGDKLHVKSALRDEFYTAENYKVFLEQMAAVGVDVDKVLFGCIHPTDLKHDPAKLQAFSTVFGVKPMTAPCCKYRLNNVWLVDSSNALYDLPYKWAQTKLGTLGEGFDTLLERRRQLIMDTFPCFKDEKCMKCPVMGFCWGQCANSDPLVHGNPSDYCNQDKLIAKVDEMNKAGKLLEYMRFQSATAMIERHSA